MDPIQVVTFHPRHLDALVAGMKLVTVRWQETIEVGAARFVFDDLPEAGTLEGRVLSVTPHPLAELTASDAHQPPRTDMAQFARELRANYYPKMPEDAVVTVVEIRVLGGPGPA